jgi:hypothetical protein
MKTTVIWNLNMTRKVLWKTNKKISKKTSKKTSKKKSKKTQTKTEQIIIGRIKHLENVLKLPLQLLHIKL